MLIARHGQTESNRDGLFCGQSETRLTELGRCQAEALCRRVAAVPIAAAYTSDLARAMETAAIVLEGRAITPQVDPDLREIHYGEWELQKERAISRLSPEQVRLMRAEDPRWQPPGGETLAAVRKRTYAALKRILHRHEHEAVLLVSHGTAIHCLIAETLAIAETHTLRLTVANCGLSEVIIRGGKPAVSYINDTSHLAGLAVTGAD